MSISALLLFGSRARGDYSDSSDIDLLAINDVMKPTVSGKGPASLYHYSYDWLSRKANQGDLFVWHIVTEALAVFDPNEQLKELRAEFRFASSYEAEILKASDVGWAISSLWSQLDVRSANRLIAWSVRTISIARAAERQIPAFSASSLAKTLAHPDIRALVEQKNSSTLSQRAVHSLSAFLGEFGYPKRGGEICSVSQYRSFFHDTSNDIGIKLLDPSTFDTNYV